MNTVITRTDEVLLPLGFHREDMAWRRSVGSLVDAIDIQVNSAGDSMTVNAGVLDPEVYEVCWGTQPPSVIEVPACTVSARVGELIDSKDRWWPLSMEWALGDIVESLIMYVLPFLERMHSPGEMEQFLFDSGVMKRRYPLPIIQLAVLMYRRGDKVRACQVLAELRRSALGAWGDRAAEVENRLGCLGVD